MGELRFVGPERQKAEEMGKTLISDGLEPQTKDFGFCVLWR